MICQYEHCDKESGKYPSRVPRKYCCREHADLCRTKKYKKNNFETVFCKVCQKSFKRYLSGPKRVYCSSECLKKSRLIGYKCLHCLEDMETQEWQRKRGRGKFCSDKCRINSRKLKAGEAIRNEKRAIYIRGAKLRGLTWELTDIEVHVLFQGDCHWCGDKPSTVIVRGKHGSYTFNGIDRANNNMGYIKDNCVSCCAICNRMKNNLEVDVFIDKIKNIYERGN